MDIRNYAGFVTAAELQNFTSAAQRLNITQSALSRQIRSLEESLGLRLFEKAGRNVRLTASGEALLSRINGVLAADRDLRAFAGDLARDQSGLLKVGACSQLIERYLPTFLPEWRAANAGIDVRLEDGGGPELAERLQAGAVHLTIGSTPSTPVEPFEMVRLGELAFMAVATPELLSDTGGPIEIADLIEGPILTLNRRHASREVFDAACRLSGGVPRIVLEGTSPHTLFALAEGGIGVAVVPSSALLTGRALVSRPITLRGELIRFDICAMWDSRVPLPAYGRRFVEALRTHILAEDRGGSARLRPSQAHLHIV
ncbi:MAG: LysR family transcriptional regulator [Alphaproteobacteria bacterium]|jgi:DNA-binding transcriptional LysR family regulator|nr:LysR family transcriptional regulator [Alphaproteobacteria bacterium]MBU0806030.1 LysR family transcriptional regulator [Alphaproteobacteria bacterium]MBU0874002.1 LysR family transcriptional regulator [Alphaproteobacteria bacterium]MBU1402175.1 LysR family transcriptional regulator [Alphaproteobacteria bacterium]MBU1590820.1 LysR family transcriptional regulator [Alphaproteobacteria bacterium]